MNLSGGKGRNAALKKRKGDAPAPLTESSLPHRIYYRSGTTGSTAPSALMFRGLSKLKSDRPPSQGTSPTRRSSETKNELAIAAPKWIIRSLYPYTAQHSDELSFKPQEFFYVNEDISGEWYLAYNPLENVKGLVPRTYFEIVQRPEQQPVAVNRARQTTHSRQTSQASVNSTPSHLLASANSQNPQISPARNSTSHHRSLTRSLSNMNIGNPTTKSSSVELHAKHTPSHSTASANSQRSSRRAHLTIYGLVLYDFQAERSDELTVSAGESIVIVAQSTDEWFVAKPIGRLGGPGLIPVTYVELREVGTDRVLSDIAETVKAASLPQVEEWKRRLAEYKASSIPLGRPEHVAGVSHQRGYSQSANQFSPQRHSQRHSQQTPPALSSSQDGRPLSVSETLRSNANNGAGHGNTANSHGTNHPNPSSSNPSGRAFVVSASVDRFAVNGGRYWYLVKVELSDGTYRNLCRFYQDFYDFQIRLLEQFPEEAGRTGKVRTLPYMPGPLTLVTHTISSQRRANLDDYVRDLIRMPPHISQSSTVLDLFSVRLGDVESSEATQELPQPPESGGQYSGDLEANAAGANSSSFSHPPYNQTAVGELEKSTDNNPMVHANASTTSTVTNNLSSSNGASLKIKVFKPDSAIALRVSAEMPFDEIYARISSRLGVQSPLLFANPHFTGEPIDNAADFARLLRGETKISLYLRP